MATFTNQATLTYNGGTASSNITTGELLEVLTATKTAVVPTYRSGRPITYLITLVNAGTADLTGLAVADDLGGYTFNGATVYPLAYTAGSVRYYRNGVLQAAPAVTAGPPLTITGITVPAGGSTVIAYEAEPTAFAPLGAEDSVVNTVTVTGAGLPDAVTATETVSAALKEWVTDYFARCRDSHGDGVPRHRTGADYQQGPVPHGGSGQRAADLHLRHPEHRQCRGGGGRQSGGDGYLRPAAQRSDGDAERNGPDRADAVHLRCRHRTVRHSGGRHHGARRHVHSECRRRVQRQSRHQHADDLRHYLSRAGSPRKQ